MSDYRLAEVKRQVGSLVSDIGPLLDQTIAAWARLDARPPRRVAVVGNGDSWAAGIAVTQALAEAGIACFPITPADCSFAPDVLGALSPDVVVLMSASGSNEGCVRVARRCARSGIRTVAVTGATHSPLANATEQAVTWRLDDLAPCPGVRTYQAALISLLALTQLATPRGERPARRFAATVSRAVDELAPVAETVSQALLARGAPFSIAVTSVGAAVGTARYVAAKLVETAAVPAVAGDIEEWWHVGRLAHPVGAPLVVLDGGHPAREFGRSLIDRSRAAGRAVIAVDDDIDELPADEWPLRQQVLGPLVAYAVGQSLGRTPFAPVEPATVGDHSPR